MKINKYLFIASLAAIASCSDSDSDSDGLIFRQDATTNVEKFSFDDFDKTKPSFVSLDDTTPDDKKWTLVENLSDEFNDGFDKSKWRQTDWNYPDISNQIVPTFMSNDNSGVADGNLWIKATLRENDVRWFQSSRIQSRAKIKFPMYTECSIKTAHLSAYNTFWMNNGNSSGRDEIDIIENNSKPTSECLQGQARDFPYQMNSQYFIVKNNVTERNKGNFDNRSLSDANPMKAVRWNEGYHIVGAWWKDARNVQFYLDGEPAGNVTTQQDFTLEQELLWDLWTFSACWLGGEANKSDLADDSINTMRVDWVRTWKLEDK